MAVRRNPALAGKVVCLARGLTYAVPGARAQRRTPGHVLIVDTSRYRLGIQTAALTAAAG